jgi:hypothetical protein
MQNDRTIKIRISDGELEEWRKKAGERGLSSWIRERCNGGSTENTDESRVDRGHRVGRGYTKVARHVGVADEAGEPIVSAAMCSHDYGPKKCPFPDCRNYKWRK